MFKVAVIGASGLLGRALVNELAQQASWQVVATAFSRPGPNTVALDIRDARAVEQGFQFALFALGHLFLRDAGECHSGALN